MPTTLISKYPKKNIPKTILNLELKFPANNTLLFLAGNSNFKFKIVFWNIFFFEILRFEKHITLSEKKPPLETFMWYLVELYFTFSFETKVSEVTRTQHQTY